MDPRFLLTYAFGEPSEEERQRPESWRFWRALPPKGRIGIFFGSWYTRPILDRAYGEIGNKELDAALARIQTLERELVQDGMLLAKFWFHLSQDAQKKRLKELEKSSETRWRVTKTDWRHYKLYRKFRKVDERVLEETSIAEAPWTVVEATDRRYQALTVGRKLLGLLTRRLDETPAKSASRPAPARPAPRARETPTLLDRLDLTHKLSDREYEEQFDHYRAKLNLLWRKAKARGLSSILVFEGWDAAGKGGAIRRVTGALDARDYRVVPIAAPTEEERAHHYLWRFWRHLPAAGRLTIFDRSWYGRLMVERVEGFATEAEWSRAYAEICDFEAQLTESGYALLKFFLHLSRDEQLRRFKEREKTPWKRFKITEEDFRNREKWDLYEPAVNEMLGRTGTPAAPWTLVEANCKRYARVKVLKALCARLKDAL
jgi:polyphosphate:AMP phosphotransferase